MNPAAELASTSLNAAVPFGSGARSVEGADAFASMLQATEAAVRWAAYMNDRRRRNDTFSPVADRLDDQTMGLVDGASWPVTGGGGYGDVEGTPGVETRPAIFRRVRSSPPSTASEEPAIEAEAVKPALMPLDVIVEHPMYGRLYAVVDLFGRAGHVQVDLAGSHCAAAALSERADRMASVLERDLRRAVVLNVSVTGGGDVHAAR